MHLEFPLIHQFQFVGNHNFILLKMERYPTDRFQFKLKLPYNYCNASLNLQNYYFKVSLLFIYAIIDLQFLYPIIPKRTQQLP